MKKLLFLIAALLPAAIFAQAPATNFTLTGKVGNLTTPARAYLFYQLGATKVVDSAQIVNGNFSISGAIADPSYSMLVIDRLGVGIPKLGDTPDLINFFLAKGTINITAAKDSIKYASITGSQLNDDSKKLTQLLEPINEEAKKLTLENNAAKPEQQNSADFQHQMQTRLNTVKSKQRGVFKDFVSSHPSSYMSLIVISQIIKQGGDPDLDALFTGLEPSIKDMEIGKYVKKMIDETKTTSVGSVAPDFTQPDVNGNPVKLSSFKGKYLLVDFWASWCGPCRGENPNVVRAYNKYKTKNFTILGVSLDKPGHAADWQAAVKSDGLAWTQVSDLKFWDNQAAQLYQIHSIPANFLLDPNGKIIGRDLRGTDLEDKLAELFGK